METARYIARRLVYAAIMMLCTSAMIFFLINMLGNPVQLMLAETPGISQSTIDLISSQYGLDKPLLQRYFIWLGSLLHLNFGTSIVYNLPVGEMISSWGLQTAKIQLPAIIISVLLALLAGTYAARRQHSRRDFSIMGVVLLGQAMPAFFLGVILIYLFSFLLGWFPSYGAISTRRMLMGSPFFDGLWHMVLPVAMLTFFNIATLTLLVRTNMIDTLRQDFIKTARASGLTESAIIRKHALRMVLLPVITYVGLLLGLMLGTAPVTETVFTWPGLGSLYVTAIQQLDYPLIMGISIVIALMLICMTTLTDIVYAIVDPRVRLS
jgi:ABC-type dipeptide/oligopeptide/nickel transport system permease component